MKRSAATPLLCAWCITSLCACAPLLPPPTEEAPPPVVVPAPPTEEMPPPPPTRPAPPPSPRYRERERRALSLLRQDELAKALTAWKVLQVLDPQNPEYPRQISATRALIRHRVQQHLAQADAAFASGDRDRAQVQYLKVLALDPGQTEVLGRLREIDRERALAVQTERLAKMEAKRAKRSDGNANGGGVSRQERDYLETGIALLKQGEYEESVLEIQKYLQAFPDDAEARRYLEDARAKLGAPSSPPPAASPAAPPPRSRPPAEPTVTRQPPPAGAPRATPEPGAESGPAAGRSDERNRDLAQEAYENGLRASRTDIAQAIAYWEEALRYDPEHVQARLQLERARRMQRTLEQIPEQ